MSKLFSLVIVVAVFKNFFSTLFTLFFLQLLICFFCNFIVLYPLNKGFRFFFKQIALTSNKVLGTSCLLHCKRALVAIYYACYFISLLITICSMSGFSHNLYNTFVIFNFCCFQIDSVAILFILLMSILNPICFYLNFIYNFSSILSIRLYNRYRSLVLVSNVFSLYLSLLSIILFLFFTVQNLFYFYILFEFSVLPLCFILGVFGSRLKKIKAVHYLVFFTVYSSIFFFLGLLLLQSIFGSLDLFILLTVEIPESLQHLLWFFFFISFATKVPILPFHIWLPEAHVEASTEGSVILAGLLLKLGLFGIIRFLIPILPKACLYFTPLVYTISIVSIFYLSFTIFLQSDIKKIIAYSSIIHMNFALLGLFSGTYLGIQGSVFLMFSHGLVSSGLFIVAGALYLKYRTRNIFYFQGLSSSNPVLANFFFLLILSNFGLPGTSGFVGEFLIILGLFKQNFFIALISLIGPLFSVLYSLFLYYRIFDGVLITPVLVTSNVYKLKITKPVLSRFEFNVLIHLSLYNILLGVFPTPILQLLDYAALNLSITLSA